MTSVISKEGILEHLAYRADIDGLRAVAVLGVLLFHAFPMLLPGGFAGVDVFFVISGYLITALIVQDFGRGGFSIWNFYDRRIRRIFPALLAMLLVVWGLGYALLVPGEFRMLGKSLLHSAYFSNNFLLFGQAGYFDSDAELKPLLHLWSLAVEEQFYIIWPCLLWVFIRVRSYGRWLPLFLAIFSLIGCVITTPENQAAAFFLPQYRGWELLAGAIVALHGRQLRKELASRSRFCAAWIGFFGLCLILGAFIYIDGRQPYPGWRAIVPVCGAVFVVLAEPNSWFSQRALAARPLVAIGLISYPLYLWHWPLFSFARILYGEPSFKLMLALILISVLLSWATFFYLETPVRRSRNFFVRAAWFPVAGLILLAGIGGLGDITRNTGGFPERVEGNSWMGLNWSDSQISDQACFSDLAIKGIYCLRQHSSAVSDVLLGDSHANHFYQGLRSVVVGEGRNLLQIEGPLNLGAGPLWSNLKWVISNTDVKTVYVAYHYGRFHQKDNPFAGSVEQMLDQLFSAGKRVFFIVDNPEFDFDPRLCTERPAIAQWLGSGSNSKEKCSESIEFMHRKRSDYDLYVASLARLYPNLLFIDAFSVFCNGGKCSAIEEGALLFRDRHHLSERGAERVFSQSGLPTP